MVRNIGQQYAALLLVIILSCSGLLAYFSLEEGHDWGGDFALYFRQAGSLLDGSSEELLAFNSYAMENSTQQEGPNPQIGPHLYPWGFPLLLTPLVAFFGYDVFAAKVYMIFFFLFSLLLTYQLVLPRLGRVNSLCLVAVLAFCPFLLQITNVIISDIPYFFFALLSLLFIEKTLGYRRLLGNKAITYTLTGFLIFFSFLLRTNGIVLLGVLGLGHLFKWYQPLKLRFGSVLKNEWKELIPYIGFVVFFLLSRAMLSSGSGSHLAFLQRLTPGKLVWNVMYYIELPATFFQGALFPMLLYGFTLPFLLLGIWRRFFKMPDALYLIYSAATLFVFILWPPVQGLRFIFSLLPFYLYFVFVGLLETQSFIRQEQRQGFQLRLVPVFSLVVVGMFLFTNILHVRANYPERPITEGPYTPQSQEAFSYVSAHTGPEDEVVFFKPRTFSFVVNRKSLRVTKLSEIKEGKGDYLLYYKAVDFGQLSAEEFRELQGCVKPIFENEQYVLIDLRRLPEELAASK